MPVLAGYTIGKENLKTTVNGGVIFNLYTWPHDFFKINTGVSLYLGIDFEEKINEKFSLFAEPYYRYQLTNMTADTISYLKFVDVVGINIGARYFFKSKHSGTMRSKLIALFALILANASCRKSNYSPPVTPVIPDSLLNWNVIGNIPGKPLEDIWFTSPSRGFTVGDKIYQTNDGGLTWAAIPNTSEINNFFNLFFVNSQSGFAQSGSQLATTVDGGNSWAVKTLPTSDGLTLFFVDPSVGFYGDESGGGLKKTGDAGNSWNTVFNDPGEPQGYYPFFLDEDTRFCGGGFGNLCVHFGWRTDMADHDRSSTRKLKFSNIQSTAIYRQEHWILCMSFGNNEDCQWRAILAKYAARPCGPNHCQPSECN